MALSSYAEVLHHTGSFSLAIPFFDILSLISHIFSSSEANHELYLVLIIEVGLHGYYRHTASLDLLQKSPRLLLVHQQLPDSAFLVLKVLRRMRILGDVNIMQKATASVRAWPHKSVPDVHLALPYALDLCARESDASLKRINDLVVAPRLPIDAYCSILGFLLLLSRFGEQPSC